MNNRLLGSVRTDVASRLVHGFIRSRPGRSGTVEREPEATMRYLAWSCWRPALLLLLLTSTAPRPVIRALPRTTVAPAFSRRCTWPLSSDILRFSRLVIQSRKFDA